jgi:hypothetical protein
MRGRLIKSSRSDAVKLYTYRYVIIRLLQAGTRNYIFEFDDVAIRTEKNPKSFSELFGEISRFST